MIQRKQTLFLLVAAVLGVITLSLPIATVTDQGLTVSQIYNLLWLDSQHVAHFGVWPLFAILLLASALSIYTIFIYREEIDIKDGAHGKREPSSSPLRTVLICKHL